jgi:hypothetical protein
VDNVADPVDIRIGLWTIGSIQAGLKKIPVDSFSPAQGARPTSRPQAVRHQRGAPRARIALSSTPSTSLRETAAGYRSLNLGTYRRGLLMQAWSGVKRVRAS